MAAAAETAAQMTVSLFTGDCREILPTLEAESFDCILTSPPYWGLRDYGTAEWAGGDPACDHLSATKHQAQGAASARSGRSNVDEQRNETFRAACGKCGAQRVDRQIGLEPTLDGYVETIAGVARELWRVLKPRGTFWLNLGDCYAGSWGAQSRGWPPSEKSALKGNGHVDGGPKIKSLSSVQIEAHPRGQTQTGSLIRTPGLKPKDLCMVPARVALRLQADGWWLRKEIIWAKPNPMPESVTDRPTSSHEKVYLFAKSESYFYDAAAIAEPVVKGSAGSSFHEGKTGSHQLNRASKAERIEKDTRNARDVWTIPTTPYRGAHFAVMPPALAERCILAGCPEGDHVLDPFGGAGTTGLVADRLGRHATLIDLNLGYKTMQIDRITSDAPLFADIK